MNEQNQISYFIFVRKYVNYNYYEIPYITFTLYNILEI